MSNHMNMRIDSIYSHNRKLLKQEQIKQKKIAIGVNILFVFIAFAMGYNIYEFIVKFF